MRVRLARSSPHSSYENVAELLREARAAHRAPVQLHVPGADETFAVETRSARATSTTGTWRKGRYRGWLAMTGPGLRGDVEDAEHILKRFLAGVPRA